MYAFAQDSSFFAAVITLRNQLCCSGRKELGSKIQIEQAVGQARPHLSLTGVGNETVGLCRTLISTRLVPICWFSVYSAKG